nr:hypothetical protein [Tanacetum cinerariifolium]
EDDVEPGVILERLFKRLVNGIVDFGNGVITVYPEQDPFKDNSEKTKKSPYDWDYLLDFNQEVRLVIETMAYHDKYKKVLDEIWKDKVELDGMIVKEEEEAIKRLKAPVVSATQGSYDWSYQAEEEPANFSFMAFLASSSSSDTEPVETSIPAATPNPTRPKSNSSGKRWNRKTCFVCKSMDHLIKDCDYHAKKMAQPTPKNYAHRDHSVDVLKIMTSNSPPRVTVVQTPVVSATQ